MKGQPIMTALRSVGLAAALVCATGSLHAGEQQDAALNRAIEAIARRNYPAAVGILTRAIQEVPEDTRLWYFLGEAYNGAREFESALEALRMAQSMGHTSPRFRQALGEALLGLGRPRRALKELEQGPNTARNCMARATALVQIGDARKALDQLDAALKLDPSLESRIRLLRASALAQLGRREEARAEIASGTAKTRNRALLDLYGRLDVALARRAPEPPRRWGLELTLGSGYNDNVTYSPSRTTAVLAQEISRERDFFVTEGLSGWYRLLGDERTGAIGRAGFSAKHLFHQDGFKTLSGYGSLEGYHTVDRLRLELGLSYGHAAVGGDEFSREWAGWGTVRWQEARWTRTNLTVQGADRGFFFDAIDEEDRDGQLYVATLSQDFSLPVLGRDLRLVPYVEAGSEQTNGDSAENDFLGVGMQVWMPLLKRLDAFGHAGYRDRSFHEPHVRTNFTARRQDIERSLGLGLRWTVNDYAYVTLQWNHVDNSSRLSEYFAYRQNTFAVYLTLHF